MKKIITISREFGAGAGEIGHILASRLGFDYVGKEIILKTAREANMDVESAFKWDEAVPKNFGFAQSLFDFYNRPLNEKLFAAQKEVIRRYGEKGNCVIVGRNANTILKEFDDSLHVFICADKKWRMNRMMGILPDAEASALPSQMDAIDKRRSKYCSYYTNTVFGNASNYDLCLNTSTLGIEKCADIIEKIARNS